MQTTTPSITIRTNFTPAFTFNPISKTSATGAKDFLFKLLRPSVDTSLPLLGDHHYAPAGEPTGYGLAVMGGVLALALYGAFKLTRRFL